MPPRASPPPSIRALGQATAGRIKKRMSELLHASDCRRGPSCPRIRCFIMKRCLQHTAVCTKRNCSRSYCLSSRELIRHWKKCQRCQVCREVNLGRDSAVRERGPLADQRNVQGLLEPLALRALEGVLRALVETAPRVQQPGGGLAALRPPANRIRAQEVGNNIGQRVATAPVRQPQAVQVRQEDAQAQRVPGGLRAQHPNGAGISVQRQGQLGQNQYAPRQNMGGIPGPRGQLVPLMPGLNALQRPIFGYHGVQPRQQPGVHPPQHQHGVQQQMGAQFGAGAAPYPQCFGPNYGHMMHPRMAQGMPGHLIGHFAQNQMPMPRPIPAFNGQPIPPQPFQQPQQIHFGTQQMPVNAPYAHPAMPRPNRPNF